MAAQFLLETGNVKTVVNTSNNTLAKSIADTTTNTFYCFYIQQHSFLYSFIYKMQNRYSLQWVTWRWWVSTVAVSSLDARLQS